MPGQPEDEAITLAFRVGDTCLTSVSKILELLIRIAEEYKRNRSGAVRKDGVVSSATKAIGDAVHDAAEKSIDGIGTVGFVKNRALGDDVTFIDAENIFDTDDNGLLTPEGKKQWNSLRKAVIENGIGISIDRNIPGSGMIRIGVSAKDINLLTDGLLKAGIDMGIVDPRRARSEEPSSEKSEKDVIESGELTFRRDPDAAEGGWVATDPDDPRRKIVVNRLSQGEASWKIVRNGETLSEGKVSSLSDYRQDPRVQAYRHGSPVYDVDENGERVPVWKRSAEGEIVRDADGKPVQAHIKVFCPIDDPRVAGFEIEAGLDGVDIAKTGDELESAMLDARLRLEQMKVPNEIREANEREVYGLNKAAERLGKDRGGARGAGEAETRSKDAAKPKNAIEEDFKKAKAAADRSTARSARPQPHRAHGASR